jgi:PiT family inorganic phosphate transporter
MDMTLILIFLSSGLFLGWSLGANDAANVFGTAVGSRMVTFITAAILCSVFIILGAVISGAGAAHGLGKLGAVNAIAGSFMCAFSAALTVFWMTKLGLPVSTTQAVVGAIIGWNLFTGSITDIGALIKILGTWVACPVLGAIFGALIYKLAMFFIDTLKPHLLRLDQFTRYGLIIAGIAGSYSLGANNIGNVMGVFVSSSPFTDLRIGDFFTLTGVQQLFLLGGIAIAVGVITYSKRVMMTVGNTLFPLNPVGAFVVVITLSIVLFLFSSTGLEHFLVSVGLPPIPLIPVSSSQAVVGAIIGIGLLKGVSGARQIKWGVLLNIGSGWVSTPLIAAIICFFMLFFLQNVFDQQVYRKVYYRLSQPVLEHLQKSGVPTDKLLDLKDRKIAKGLAFRNEVRERVNLPGDQERLVISAAEIYEIQLDAAKIGKLDKEYLGDEKIRALEKLAGQSYLYKWQLHDALVAQTTAWKKKPATKLNKAFNKKLGAQLDYLYHTFHIERKLER